MLNDRFGEWSPDVHDVADFFARTGSARLGGTQFTECICDPCGATRRVSRRTDPGFETVTFQLTLSGSERFKIGDDWHELQAGDLLIWNDLKSMRFEVLEQLHKASVTIPLSRFRAWMPVGWHKLPSFYPKGSPVSTMLSSLMTTSMSEAARSRICDGDAIADAMLGGLFSVFGRDAQEGDGSLREAHFLRAKNYIIQHIGDPNLSPQDVASALKISVRYLHHVFECVDLSFRQFVISERLQRARQDLANVTMRGRTVTDIAFSWGFQSSAHFSRRFRDAFGETPTEYRRSVFK